jgi:mRNA interferase MazF
VRRGELWTAAAGQGYAGKPRPVLIVQDDRFDATDSITVCPLTTTTTDVPLLRIPLQPNRANGLTTLCSVMLDKITTVRRSRLGHCIGRVSTTEMLQVERGILVFFGMTG